MPLLWDLDGNGVGEAEVEERNLHGIAAHGTHHLSGDPLAGIENLLASGAIYVLGDLYHLSEDTIFRDAAKRFVEPLVESVLDPYHDPAAAAISYYRRTFQDTTFDQPMRGQLVGMPPIPRHLALIFPQEVRRREHWVSVAVQIWHIGANGRTTVRCSQSGNHQQQP